MLNVSNTTVAAASLLMLQSVGGARVQAGERQILLTNNTRELIVEIYISDAGVGNWQADLLGSDFLPPGEAILVDIDDRNGRCRVDFKTVLDDGTELLDRGVNVCRSADQAVSLR
ncbi:MAG TPA: hypothetical protein VGI28_10135 [Stellaceae bacterium]